MDEDSPVYALIHQACDPATAPEDLREAVGAAFSAIPRDRQGAEAVLRRFAEEILDTPTRPDVAGFIALGCGALVERGLGPTVALGPILVRLERQVAPEAISFAAACRQAASEDPAAEADGV